VSHRHSDIRAPECHPEVRNKWKSTYNKETEALNIVKYMHNLSKKEKSTLKELTH